VTVSRAFLFDLNTKEATVRDDRQIVANELIPNIFEEVPLTSLNVA
jgi:hypothetical protein